MPKYPYQAVNSQGDPATGEIEATSADHAQMELEILGFTKIQITDLTEDQKSSENTVHKSESQSSGSSDQPPETAIVLDEAQAQDLLTAIEQLAQAGLPLAAGLRAAANESRSAKLQQSLLLIAGRLEKGEILEEIFNDPQVQLPKSFTTLLKAGLTSGNLPEVLSDLVELEHWHKDFWRGLWSALSYSLLLLGLTILVIDGLGLFVMPVIYQQLVAILEDFELELPYNIEVLKVGHTSWLFLLLLFFMLTMMWRLLLGKVRFARFCRALPVFGSILWYGSALDFVEKLRMMLRQTVSLPTALRQLHDSLRDPAFAQQTTQWANEVEQGKQLSLVLSKSIDAPQSMVPLVAWGEKNNQLEDALAEITAMYKDRMLIKRDIVRYLFQGIICLVVIGSILWLFTRAVLAMSTLVTLLQFLS